MNMGHNWQNDGIRSLHRYLFAMVVFEKVILYMESTINVQKIVIRQIYFTGVDVPLPGVQKFNPFINVEVITTGYTLFVGVFLK